MFGVVFIGIEKAQVVVEVPIIDHSERES